MDETAGCGGCLIMVIIVVAIAFGISALCRDVGKGKDSTTIRKAASVANTWDDIRKDVINNGE